MNGATKIKVRIEGTRPLLMHNGRLANPMDPYTLALKKCSSVKKKTQADHLNTMEAEFLGSLYHSPKIGVFIPSNAIEGTLIEGAKKNKLGKAFKGAVSVLDDAPLLYSGPKTPDKLWKDEKFRDARMVAVNQARVVRCRPIFQDWASEFEILLENEMEVSVEDVRTALTAAGSVGLLDYRPKFGRFEVTEFEQVEE